jgi:PEP-CTERM motif
MCDNGREKGTDLLLLGTITERVMKLTRIAFLALTAIAAVASTTYADGTPFTLDVTANTNAAVCAAVDQTCSPISLNLQMDVTPATNSFGNILQVTDVTGMMNGQSPVSFGVQQPGTFDWLLSGSNVPFGWVNFQAGGDTWLLYFDDLITGSTAVTDQTGQSGFAYISWDTAPASTPEPGSVVLLAIGLLGLLGFGNRTISRKRPISMFDSDSI